MSSDSLVYTPAKAQVILEEIFDTYIDETVTEGQFAMDEVFDVGMYKRAVYKSLDGAGPGLPARREVMEPLAPRNWSEGDMFTAREFQWGAQVAVPQELIRKFAKFGERDPDISAAIGSYANFTRAMKFNSFRVADLECVNLLINGTSTTAPYVGRRSEALFMTNHAMVGSNPTATQGNLTVNLSLTEPNLFMVINAIDTQKDSNGAPIKGDRGGYVLVTGPALRSKAWTILNTEQQIGSANNDKNIIYSMKSKITPVVWDEFPLDFTGWFVFKKGFHGLKFLWMEKPYNDKESDLNTNSLRYSMNSSGRAFWDTWLGSYASLPS